MIRFLQTPGPVKKIVFGGLLVLLSLAMLVYLIPGGMFGSGEETQRGVVADVAGETVTTVEVRRDARSMIQQQYPRGGAEAEFMEPIANRQAAEQLINQKVLDAEAHRVGLHVTDDELSDELQHGGLGETFFPGGQFIGQDAYQSRIEQQFDMTVPQFEQAVKDDILIQKLRTLVYGSVTVSDADVHKEFISQNTKVKFDYAFFSKDDVEKTLHPTDTELHSFYDQNKQMYANSIPEQRKISYVVLDEQHIASSIPITDEDINNYYDQHRDQYVTPEQVNVSQILIKEPLPAPDGKVDQKAKDVAHAKAQDVLNKLKSGGNFADLAKKYSEDPSSKSGGSIGWVQHGGFPVADVDKAAFSLAKGATSDVIDAGYAFVILHIDDKKPAEAKSVAEVKNEITPLVQQEKAGQVADDAAQKLLTAARSTSLAQAATAQGLQVVTTDFVNRNSSLPGIGSAPSFTEAVFSAPVNAPPDESQVPSGFAIYQVTEIKPAATPTFDAIKGQVEQQFKDQRVQLVLPQKAQELSDKAKSEHDLKKAAKELGATFKSSDFVLPNGQVPDLGSMTGPASVAFSLKPGQISNSINAGNNAAVIEVTDSQPPAESDFAAKRDEIREGLLQTQQQESFGLFLSNAREQMEKSGKLKINKDEYNALTKMQGGPQGE